MAADDTRIYGETSGATVGNTSHGSRQRSICCRLDVVDVQVEVEVVRLQPQAMAVMLDDELVIALALAVGLDVIIILRRHLLAHDHDVGVGRVAAEVLAEVADLLLDEVAVDDVAVMLAGVLVVGGAEHDLWRPVLHVGGGRIGGRLGVEDELEPAARRRARAC